MTLCVSSQTGLWFLWLHLLKCTAIWFAPVKFSSRSVLLRLPSQSAECKEDGAAVLGFQSIQTRLFDSSCYPLAIPLPQTLQQLLISPQVELQVIQDDKWPPLPLLSPVKHKHCLWCLLSSWLWLWGPEHYPRCCSQRAPCFFPFVTRLLEPIKQNPRLCLLQGALIFVLVVVLFLLIYSSAGLYRPGAKDLGCFPALS